MKQSWRTFLFIGVVFCLLLSLLVESSAETKDEKIKRLEEENAALKKQN